VALDIVEVLGPTPLFTKWVAEETSSDGDRVQEGNGKFSDFLYDWRSPHRRRKTREKTGTPQATGYL
jgi:hypothetical protein